MKTCLRCALCGADLGGDPASLDMIQRDCGRDTNVRQQAEILVKKHKRKPSELFCERCFWLFEGVRPIKPKSVFWAMIAQFLALTLLIFSIVSLCFGVAMFFSGYHSLDQAYDLERMALYLNADPNTMQLCSIDNVCDTFGNVYTSGVRTQIFGFILGLASAFYLPLTLFVLIKTIRGETK